MDTSQVLNPLSYKGNSSKLKKKKKFSIFLKKENKGNKRKERK